MKDAAAIFEWFTEMYAKRESGSHFRLKKTGPFLAVRRNYLARGFLAKAEGLSAGMKKIGRAGPKKKYREGWRI